MTERPRIVITGAGGQLGQALQRHAPADIECVALNHAQLDITDHNAVTNALDGCRPQAVINTAAYTAVDRAEAEPERAGALNATAPARLANFTAERGIRLIHLSTDFVFAGSAGRPYRLDDTPAPLNIYGDTKLAGERAVLAAQPNALVVRTAWLYGAGGSNFLATLLKLMTTREEVGIVADQVGSPTSTDGLAQALWHALERKLSGIHHWTEAGVASWYDFAVAIAEEATAIELLTHMPKIRPIRTEDYPTAARRPSFSVLDKSTSWAALGHVPPHWRVALRAVLRKCKEQSDNA